MSLDVGGETAPIDTTNETTAIENRTTPESNTAPVAEKPFARTPEQNEARRVARQQAKAGVIGSEAGVNKVATEARQARVVVAAKKVEKKRIFTVAEIGEAARQISSGAKMLADVATNIATLGPQSRGMPKIEFPQQSADALGGAWAPLLVPYMQGGGGVIAALFATALIVGPYVLAIKTVAANFPDPQEKAKHDTANQAKAA